MSVIRPIVCRNGRKQRAKPPFVYDNLFANEASEGPKYHGCWETEWNPETIEAQAAFFTEAEEDSDGMNV